MTVNQSPQTHLSKDELMEILNEIDAERAAEPVDIRDHQAEKSTRHIYPDPGNPFY